MAAVPEFADVEAFGALARATMDTIQTALRLQEEEHAVEDDDDGKPRRSDLYRSAQQQVLIRLAPH